MEFGKWEPIETAPKYTDLLLCVAGCPPCVGHFDKELDCWVDFGDEDDGYRESFKDDRSEYEPTHWMPLPATADSSP